MPPPTTMMPFDYLGEYEAHTTEYRLTALVPNRPPCTSSFEIVQIFHRDRIDYTNYDASEFCLAGSDRLPRKKTYFVGRNELPYMDTKTVKLKAYEFPLEFRCEHLSDGVTKKCSEGCYIVEKYADKKRERCSDKDCQGHRCVIGREDGKGRLCFGRKGERLVLLDPKERLVPLDPKER